MATMHDVARRAGVSVMTVSNVINERPHVRAATRERVRAAIDELGYAVNATARSLRQGRTGVICLAVPEIDRPYFGILAQLVIERAATDGFEVVIEQTGAARAGELGALAHSRLRSYDGLIINAVRLAGADAALLRSELPVVVLGERAYAEPVDRVAMDNVAGGALAVRHLVDSGRRSVAMIGGRMSSGPADIDAATERARGFLAGAAERGVDADPRRIVESDFSLEGGRDGVRRLLEAGIAVDGLFCATDLIAIGAVRALADHGLRVPVDVGVVGFDDVPLASFTTPSLTSVAPDRIGMVDAAVSMVVARIRGERADADYREVVGAMAIIERESTATIDPN